MPVVIDKIHIIKKIKKTTSMLSGTSKWCQLEFVELLGTVLKDATTTKFLLTSYTLTSTFLPDINNPADFLILFNVT